MTSGTQVPKHSEMTRKLAHFLLASAVVFLLLGFVSSVMKARADRYVPKPQGAHTITNVMRMEVEHFHPVVPNTANRILWEGCGIPSTPLPPSPVIRRTRDVIVAFHPLRAPPLPTA